MLSGGEGATRRGRGGARRLWQPATKRPAQKSALGSRGPRAGPRTQEPRVDWARRPGQRSKPDGAEEGRTAGPGQATRARRRRWPRGLAQRELGAGNPALRQTPHGGGGVGAPSRPPSWPCTQLSIQVSPGRSFLTPAATLPVLCADPRPAGGEGLSHKRSFEFRSTLQLSK